jgi:hypothetical protein
LPLVTQMEYLCTPPAKKALACLEAIRTCNSAGARFPHCSCLPSTFPMRVTGGYGQGSFTFMCRSVGRSGVTDVHRPPGKCRRGQQPGGQRPRGSCGQRERRRSTFSLSAEQLAYFQDGLSRFEAIDSVGGVIPGETDSGLGPTFNADSCGSSHAQPSAGGTSPSTNPQIAAATANGATNSIPDFLSAGGPVREVRFPFLLNSNGALSRTPDGGVHDLFTIAGRTDAPGCNMTQPDFAQMQELGNLAFRMPTPLYGAGLIENIPDAAIYANMPRTRRSSRVWEFRAIPTSAATMGRSYEDHAGSGSEANRVVNLFQQLNAQQQQDLLNFLRSL